MHTYAFSAPSHFPFRLLEVPFRDKTHYPADILTAFLTPVMIKDKFTYPGSRSTKEPLPPPIFNAIMKVARLKLKGTDMTMAEFKEKLRLKFRTWKLYEPVSYHNSKSYNRLRTDTDAFTNALQRYT